MPNGDFDVVQKQPELKTGIAHCDFEACLSRRSQRFDGPLKMASIKPVIGINEDPEFVSILDLPLLLYIRMSLLQPVNNMSG